VQSGDVFQLQITLLADPAAAPYREADGVIVSANGTTGTPTAAHFWPFIVISTAESQDAGIMMQARRARPFGHTFARGSKRAMLP
jgi:hypothetical protein